MIVRYSTILINLEKTEEELWKQIGNLRTDVRKWEKNNIKIELNPSKEDIDSAYNLYLIMMKKKYLPVLRSYSLHDMSNNRIIIAKKDDKVISYIQLQLFSHIDIWKCVKVCALNTIATDDDYKSLSPNTLLYWECIKYAKSLWFEYLNFNGVTYQYWDKDFNSLAFFKRKWNGLEITCISDKSFFWYIYWRWFRKFNFIKRMTYFCMVHFFKKKYLFY